MPFHVSKEYHDEDLPGRAYVHSGGFRESFRGDCVEALRYFREEALPVIRGAVEEEGLTPKNPRYFLATIWGGEHTGTHNVDVFVFGDLETWSGNPQFAAGTIVERKLVVPSNKVVGCGDSLIMLGLEETFRRSTSNMRTYLSDSVIVPGIPWWAQQR